MNPWFLGIGILFGAGALFCAALGVLGLKEENVGKSFGRIKKIRGYRNTHEVHNTVIPHLSVYSYEYRVGEKKYYISCKAKAKPRYIPEKRAVYYLKCFPRLAGIDRYSGQGAWLLFVSCLLMAALMLMCSFMAA